MIWEILKLCIWNCFKSCKIWKKANHLLLPWIYGVQLFCCSCADLFHLPSQNNLIRELEHTKKLIEDSHHEKVRDSFSFCTHCLGALDTKWSLSMSLGAALDPDWDHQGWEWPGSEQEQLLAAWVSLLPVLTFTLWLVFQIYLYFSCFFRRSQMVNTPDFRFPVSSSSMMDSNSEHYGGALVQRRPQKGRMAALRDEPSKVSSQALMLALVCHNQKVFEHLLWLGCCLFSLLCFILS